MRLRHIVTPVLLVIAVASFATFGILLVDYYSGEELTEINTSFQIVIFMFTASAGSLALIKHWRSVETELEHKRWEKLNHLEASYLRF